MTMKVSVLICQIALGMSLRLPLNTQPAGLHLRTDEHSDEPSKLKLQNRQGFEMPAVMAYTGPDAPKFDTHALCNRLMTKLDKGGNPDVAECYGKRSGDFVINNMCLSTKESFKRVDVNHESPHNLNIAIISADDREHHESHGIWRAYAKYHGYTYVNKHSQYNLTDHMINDWMSTSMILKILDDPAYKHIDHFMYVELDMWPVQPLAKLEPIFAEAGLLEAEIQLKFPAQLESNQTQSKFHWPWESDPRKLFAAVSEYPCADIRDGGVFNMGNFLFVRHEKVHELFTNWYESQSHNSHWTSEYPYNTHTKNENTKFTKTKWSKTKQTKAEAEHPTWPARQGAFSHGGIYDKYKDIIHRFENGNPLGSPFATMVGHLTGGFIEDTYDPELARSQFPMLWKCVQRRLETGDKQPCALYPRWVGGSCVTCQGSLDADGKAFGFYTGKPEDYHYTGCCGKIDSALPLETFISEVKGNLHQPGVKVDLTVMAPLDGDASS